MSEDGRIADPRLQSGTTSEGQAYALFFALVAGDQTVFDRLLRWTEDNLAAGDLRARLPAWRWGRRDDQRWDVIDRNAAADADLWLAYTLAEAGRLWRTRRYEALSYQLTNRIALEEMVTLPRLGPMLLPGPVGFRLSANQTRLNPSYLPLPLLSWFARRRPEPAWRELRRSAIRLLRDSAPHGLAPDWTLHDSAAAGPADPPGPAASGIDPAGLEPLDRTGSYDAIRVYLWLGLTDPGDPDLPALLQHYAPAARLIAALGGMPEKLDPLSPAADQRGPDDQPVRADGPPGFQAAVLPFLARHGDGAAVARQLVEVRARPAQVRDYYDQVLSLFALGHHERRYRFGADGSLHTGWSACRPG
jgi:endoglucanase